MVKAKTSRAKSTAKPIIPHVKDSVLPDLSRGDIVKLLAPLGTYNGGDQPEHVPVLRVVGVKLQGVDLSGLDLSYIDFTEAVLDDASLRGCELRGTTFFGAKLRRTDLSYAESDGGVVCFD